MDTKYSCSFTRQGCTHDRLFNDGYQRTNRTKGTKILRCFPHCCPHHIERSYCGRSVHVQVDAGHPHVGSVAVFAHFHPRGGRSFAVGTRLPVGLIKNNQQTTAHTTGEWIGARQVASTSETSWIFEVNPSGRWYYQWESGATKAQRATDHQFTVYVLVHEAEGGAFFYRVAASASSPSFKLISFRRAPLETKLVGNHTPPCSDSETTRTRNSMRESMESIDTDTGIIDIRQADPVADNEGKSGGTTCAGMLSLQPPPPTRQTSQDLAAIVGVLHQLPAGQLEHVVHDLLQLVLARCGVNSTSEHDVAHLLQLLGCEPRAGSRPNSVAIAVVRVAIWVMFDGDLAALIAQSLGEASVRLLDKGALYHSYFGLLDTLQHRINLRLANRSAGTAMTARSLGEVAKILLNTQYGITLPNDARCWGLESFVAQAREVFLTSHEESRATRRRNRYKRPRLLPDRLAPLQQFRGDWVVDLSSVVSRPSHSSGDTQRPAASAFVVLWALRQLLRLEITVHHPVDEPHASLNVVSHWHSVQGESHAHHRGSQLLLDGKSRWLRTFPSGESTTAVLIGDQRVGHYVASFRAETAELAINCYTWPVLAAESLGAYAYCLRWCIRRTAAALDIRLSVECGRLPVGLEVAAMDELPLAKKLRAVSRWTTLHSLQYFCLPS